MKIPTGTKAYIGPPAQAIPEQISGAIGVGLGKIPEILEAHLPMIYIKGLIEPPAQIFMVVVEEKKPSPQAKILEVVRRVLPSGSYMDIGELYPGDPQLPAIRASGTQLDLDRK